jgi:hypothetical protein
MTLPASIPNLIGQLSNDIMLICDQQCIVREANPVALQTLGNEIVGRPVLQLLATMSRTKGRAFFDHLRRLAPGECSEPWELLFHMSQAAPLLISVRGGATDDGQWLLVGSHESPQLTVLYHEVLAINSELTNLVRQLSKEQAQLTSRIETLMSAQEHDDYAGLPRI